ncbi:glycosyltransferase family 39 protein [Phreatobacter stygius]|uniref:Glycosyltransferase family 39 protein n=1 Tax=Phreatobacter stygius TaxID=1940610 RepID=A0A4D7B3Z3_9HYPH|nr:glycosyltransferase family 39 protein [Phreatobacter stygius]QCI62842.1 glycosyltransferase family 39 protein [Phreatobacter stygius]
MLPHQPLSGAADPSPFGPRPLGAGSLGAGSLGAVLALVAVLTLIRLWAAGRLGLAADETYYWIWSKHLSFGYFDHPPAVALLIRASTAVFGDTAFGVRWLSVLLGAAASLGVWRLVIRLTDDHVAALAGAGLVQATLFLGAGAMLVTPDTPLVLFWTIALLALAELWRTGQGAWWLAVGLAVGLAFISKYSAVFLGLGILIWLAWVPELRRWFTSPWPYAGGLACLAVMAPVVAWNLMQGGASLTKQFGRAVPQAFDPRFVPEFFAGQAALLTPLVGILVLYGLFVVLGRAWREREAGATLIVATTVPLILYLLWYGLFGRVQGNWTACLLPASIAAAVIGVRAFPAQGVLAAILRVSLRFSIVVGVGLGLFVVAHAVWRIVPLTPDPTAQLFGWRDAVAGIERAAAEKGAGTIGTASYTMTGELRFHGSGQPPVVQLNERLRFAMEPAPDVARLRTRPILVVAESRRDGEVHAALGRRFRHVARAGSVERHWRAPLWSFAAGSYVDTLSLFLVADPIGEGFPDIGTPY